MKKISRLQVTAWVLSLLPAAMTAVFYSRLPAEIPMQWGSCRPYELRNQMAFVDRGRDGTAVCGSVLLSAAV